MELLERQIEITERIKREAEQREKALLTALEKQERVFMSKLNQLCSTEQTDEELESDIEKRLQALEMDFKNFKTQYEEDFQQLLSNQGILSQQLKSLQELLSRR